MVGTRGTDETGRRQTARSELGTMNPSFHLPLAGGSILSYASGYRRPVGRLRVIRRSCSAAAAAVLAASFASTGSSGAHAAGVSAALTETRGLLRVDGAGIAYRELNRTARG